MVYTAIPSYALVKWWQTCTEHNDVAILRNYRSYALENYKHVSLMIGHGDSEQCMKLPRISWDTVLMRDIKIHQCTYDNGIQVFDIRDFVRLYPEQAQKYLWRTSNRWKKKLFSTLIEACWNRGIVIKVLHGMSVHYLELAEICSCFDGLVFEKIMIIVEEGASVTIHDKVYALHTKQLFFIRSIDCFIEAGAYCTFVHDQRLEHAIHNVSRFSFYAANSSFLNFWVIHTGSLTTEMMIDTIMCGEHATVNIRGLYSLCDTQHLEICTHQEHEAAYTQSELTLKGIVKNHACINHRGMIFIDRDSKQSCADQQGNHITLDDTAHVYAMPQLEVLHHDVQCKHGSAIGSLDLEHIFFIQSRGLSQEQAKHLLLEGFFANLIALLPDSNDACKVRTQLLRNVFKS